MAFAKVVEVEVYPLNSPSTKTIIKDVFISFEVYKERVFSENFCRIKITNLNETTIRKFMLAGSECILRAGYEDEDVAVIFRGKIKRAIEKREGNASVLEVEVYTTQTAGDANSLIAESYGKSTAVDTVVRSIGQSEGLIVSGASGVILKNGFSFVGRARSALRRLNEILKSEGYSLTILEDEIIIYSVESATDFSAPILSSKTGLISAYKELRENTGEERVVFESMLNPKIQLGGNVVIEGEAVQGVFVVELLEYSGDNRSGDFRISGEAI